VIYTSVCVSDPLCSLRTAALRPNPPNAMVSVAVELSRQAGAYG